MLVAGATVRPSFGWPMAPPKPNVKKAAKPTAPFVATPVGAAVGKVGAVKAIEGASVTLADASLPAPEPTKEGAQDELAVSMSDAMDITRGTEISTLVNVANVGERSQSFLLRASTVGFKVSGPSGSVSCGNTRIPAEPPKELFTTLAPKGKTSIALLLDAMCPGDTFDTPGIYRVVPRLDTTGASGRRIGVRSFEGLVEGKRPLLLRVRTPRRPKPPGRPNLD